MATKLWTVPDHVPEGRVVDIDLFSEPSFQEHLHERLADIQASSPPVFYSPYKGGYWVVTRYKLIQKVVSDPATFSTSQQNIPKIEPPIRFVPLSIDPPAHIPYRLALMNYFGPKSTKAMSPEIRELAGRLINDAIGADEFEFVRSVGAALPVTVFMNLMGMPLNRFDEFRELACEFFEVLADSPRKIELFKIIEREMSELIESRRTEKGDDLISMLLDFETGGQRFADEDLLSMASLLFTAGLDTVANAAAFIFYYLGQDPALQDRLVENPELIPNFIEESLRMYGIVNTPRVVMKDVELDGALLQKGDMVLAMLALAGRDDQVVADPGTFDLSRQSHPHMVFGAGPHVCAGQFLARIELRVMMEEWIKRVKRFSLAPGHEPKFRNIQVMALDALYLRVNERVDGATG